MIKTTGEVVKSDFFKFLDIHPDDYSDVWYTEEEAQKIRGHLMHLVTGASAAVPLICGGAQKCPFAARCPFVRIDAARKAENPEAKRITPLGRQCLVEVNLLTEWTKLFIQEYEVDETKFTDYQMVRDLAEIELMIWRLNNNIAKPEHAELVQEQVVGVDKEGNPLTRFETSAFLETKEKLQNSKRKIIKLLVGDRQEKYKRDAALRQRAQEDPSSQAAALRQKMDNVMREAKQIDLKLKAAEGKVVNAECLPIESEEGPVTLTPEDLISEE